MEKDTLYRALCPCYISCVTNWA